MCLPSALSQLNGEILFLSSWRITTDIIWEETQQVVTFGLAICFRYLAQSQDGWAWIGKETINVPHLPPLAKIEIDNIPQSAAEDESQDGYTDSQ